MQFQCYDLQGSCSIVDSVLLPTVKERGPHELIARASLELGLKFHPHDGNSLAYDVTIEGDTYTILFPEHTDMGTTPKFSGREARYLFCSCREAWRNYILSLPNEATSRYINAGYPPTVAQLIAPTPTGPTTYVRLEPTWFDDVLTYARTSKCLLVPPIRDRALLTSRQRVCFHVPTLDSDRRYLLERLTALLFSLPTIYAPETILCYPPPEFYKLGQRVQLFN